MSLLTALLLFLAGIVSGMVNAMAGGGTFITFGALSLGGVPPITANATSSTTQFPGYITSSFAYRHDIRKFWKSAIVLCVISGVGALAGALLLMTLDNPSFRAIVPWLLLAATLIFAAGPWLKPDAKAPGKKAAADTGPPDRRAETVGSPRNIGLLADVRRLQCHVLPDASDRPARHAAAGVHLSR